MALGGLSLSQLRVPELYFGPGGGGVKAVVV
jgi:hypothetical protein